MSTEWTHRFACLGPIGTAAQRRELRKVARAVWLGLDDDNEPDTSFAVPLSVSGSAPASHYALDGAITQPMGVWIVQNANRVTGIKWAIYDAFTFQIVRTHAGPWTQHPYDPQVDPFDPNQFDFDRVIDPLKRIETNV